MYTKCELSSTFHLPVISPDRQTDRQTDKGQYDDLVTLAHTPA